MSAVPVYPVRVEGRLDPKLSRWLWLVKWLLAIPHYLVLAVLWVAFFVLTVVAFFAILFTGRYPRPIFDFNVGVLRWTWRVAFYSYSALGTDRYPPFSLEEEPDYPATLDIPYPEHLSRGLALVKWWLLALPHYLLVGLFVGGLGPGWGPGLIALLVLFAAVALVFSRRYPRGIFDLVLGLDRWALRVAAYAGLMTDAYPPFRLDMGGAEPGAVTLPEEPRTAPAGGRWGAGRILLVVAGSLAALIAVGLLAGGGTAVVVDQTQRDADGFVMSSSERFTTSTYALVSETVDVSVDGPDWLVQDAVGTVRIRGEGDSATFVGIARDSEVAAYLGGVERAIVTDLGPDRDRYDLEPGGRPVTAPEAQGFWAASASGSGALLLDWQVVEGSWAVVVMNADGSPGIAANLSIGAQLDALPWIGIGLLAGGAVLLILGATAIYLAARDRRT